MNAFDTNNKIGLPDAGSIIPTGLSAELPDRWKLEAR